LSFTRLFKVQLWIFTFKTTVKSPTFIHKLVWNSSQHIICPQILHSFQVSTFLRELIKKRQIKFCKCQVWILCVDEKKTPPILVNIWSCTFLVCIWVWVSIPKMRHKGSRDPLLVGGEGLFDNGCFFGKVVTWMEDALCVQPHVH
jgi:hypothetical protein